MLELKGVSKRYGTVTALGPLDLTLEGEKTYVLIGPSGCGKSTLLRLMVGLVKPDRGVVRIAGEELTEANLQGWRRRIGYVIQAGGLFPHLSTKENVALVARYLRWDAGRIDRRIEQLADLTHLPHDTLGRYPAQLSGGQQQRVGLMRALMLEPQLLLLDEPLGALDPMIRNDLQADLREIFRTLNKTVVLVTHDLSEAAYFADEIVLLREGEIVQRGTIEELLEAPASPFVSQFVRAQRAALGGGEEA